jgi:hypothetical protein
LLAQLHAACLTFDGEAKIQAYLLSVDAHHVTAAASA